MLVISQKAADMRFHVCDRSHPTDDEEKEKILFVHSMGREQSHILVRSTNGRPIGRL